MPAASVCSDTGQATWGHHNYETPMMAFRNKKADEETRIRNPSWMEDDNYETPMMAFRNKKADEETRIRNPSWMEDDIND